MKLNVTKVRHVAANKTSEVDNDDDIAVTHTMTWLMTSLMTWRVTSLMMWLTAAHFRIGPINWAIFLTLSNQSPLNRPIKS